MSDRERVMKELSWIINNFPKQKDPKDAADKMCNAINTYCSDAISLLKEQEARVMTREEVIATPEGVVVWMEDHSESGNYIQPIVSNGNGRLGNFYIGVASYDIEIRWRRFWTSRPTDEQRKAVKWDGERI